MNYEEYRDWHRKNMPQDISRKPLSKPRDVTEKFMSNLGKNPSLLALAHLAGKYIAFPQFAEELRRYISDDPDSFNPMFRWMKRNEPEAIPEFRMPR